MDILLHKLSGIIKRTIQGFDQIVFKGILRPIAYATGMQVFLQKNGVLNKNYKNWMIEQSSAIIETAEQYCREKTGRYNIYLLVMNARKN